ncbi:hypothetical protein QYH69_08195 [Paraburkholderia sp. SARCC-3016]|uniref:hypothetical protein n=1 Tax=Paraburkholderia sp. SARCC-3016 TaxID=3058611 RepID=UPI0028082CD3|nr:hypothetical protein [Paraburkholderia sp. SARCC-3016]MDQ7977225.1 hypothetical protein [Paraburkholderia sp. SARCC-3016]
MRANPTRPDGTSGAFNDKEAFVLSGVSGNRAYGNDAAYGDDASSNGPMINMINKGNDILNTPALASVGQTLNLLGPVGKLVHVIPDFFIGQLGSKLGEGIAHMLGEKGQVKTHFEKEWLGRDGGLKNGESPDKDRTARGTGLGCGADHRSTCNPSHRTDSALPGLNSRHTRITMKTIEVTDGSAI